jgi:N-acyl-D-aspartate/D-glutamate deacylase
VAHQKLAWLPARAAGLRDRGALLEGMAADVVVYDLAKIKRTFEGNACTGATPGRLIRHGR